MGKANSHSFKPGPDPRRGTKGRGPSRPVKLADLARGMAAEVFEGIKAIALDPTTRPADRLRALEDLARLAGGGLDAQGERGLPSTDEPVPGAPSPAELSLLNPPADPPPQPSGTVLPFPPKEQT